MIKRVNCLYLFILIHSFIYIQWVIEVVADRGGMHVITVTYTGRSTII